ncbi:MAG: leucine-rich repeat protein [Clostridia bacterium]|nr:leucine-rich repeat protein [Clostridia bacterium]
MSKKKIDNTEELDQVINIPDDEIWTYQVEGLAAPHIGKPYKNAGAKKALLAIIILIAVSLSCYFSVRTVQSDTFEYKENSQGYEFSKFSNTGYIKEITIDYVTEIEYDQENPDVTSNFTFIKDETMPITSIREYALNCDGVVEVINIGPEVLEIDGKSFYSCWALQRIEVDENNPNYCDLDGVLYSKDMKTLICYPPNHDQYLRTKFGYETEPYRADATEEYIRDIQTYVVPATVETLGELSMNYTNLRRIYLPEGLKRIETLALFKLHEPKDQWSNTPSLDNIYSYKTDAEILDSAFTSQEALGEVYLSLPEGLEYIGSDAVSYNQELPYVYIPSSVTYIGHHAFWDTLYEEGGELKGVTEMNVAADEDAFKDVKCGDSWRPQYDYMLFKKSISINYSAQRENLE